VWINLLCNFYTHCSPSGTTSDGIVPFTVAGDLSTPNEEYFSRADDMIRLAAAYGLTVLLDPIETGGWLDILTANGLAKDRAYGQYLGNRYKDFDNIIWMSGNDYTDWTRPAIDAAVRAVALGIKDNDNRHIHTLELGPVTSASLDDADWAPIVNLNAVYTYDATYAQVLNEYNRANHMPVFMVEANYEFEQNAAEFDYGTAGVLRRQEYWTMLSGATGQFYGSYYTDQFPFDWMTHLNTPGAIQFGYLTSFFGSRPWYNLLPDQTHSVVTAGYGDFILTSPFGSNDYVTAGRTPDGALVMAYVPQSQSITVDMSRLAGPVTARWYDPSNNTYLQIPGSPLMNAGLRQFAHPGMNGGGDVDWVLVLEAALAPDTQAPSVPTNLTAMPVSPNQIYLSWTASTDDRGVTGYRIYRDGVDVGTSTTTGFLSMGLKAQSNYGYAIAAFDEAGNLSAQSSTASASTPASDNVPPSVPGNLQSSRVTIDSLTVSWTASSDNLAVAGYLVFRNGILIGSTFRASYSDSGLSPSTIYSYAVAAYDYSNNISARSQALNVTTRSAPIVFVQQNNSVPQTPQSTVTAVYTNAQTTGDTNILAVGWFGTAAAISSVTDSRGNVYQIAVPSASDGNNHQAIYYARNINQAAGGSNAVTVTFSTAVNYPDIRILEYRGLDPVNPFDVGTSASGTSATASSGPVTTTSAHELIFGAGETTDTFSDAGDSFVSRVITAPDGDIAEDTVVHTTGSYSATAPLRISASWLMQVATFRATVPR
jgi:chitodextrinase